MFTNSMQRFDIFEVATHVSTCWTARGRNFRKSAPKKNRMKSFFTTAAVAALSLSAPVTAYDESERDQVFKDFPQMPPLGVFKMKEMTPKVRESFAPA